MSTIVVIDPSNVTIDGDPVGSIFDLAWNWPQIDGIQSLALAALNAWSDAIAAAHAEALVEALAAKNAEASQFRSTIAALQAQVDTLGGTELAQKLARDAKRKAAEDALAKAQADLAAFDTAEEKL